MNFGGPFAAVSVSGSFFMDINRLRPILMLSQFRAWLRVGSKFF